jgi:hypothetical protein
MDQLLRLAASELRAAATVADSLLSPNGPPDAAAS